MGIPPACLIEEPPPPCIDLPRLVLRLTYPSLQSQRTLTPTLLGSFIGSVHGSHEIWASRGCIPSVQSVHAVAGSLSLSAYASRVKRVSERLAEILVLVGGVIPPAPDHSSRLHKTIPRRANRFGLALKEFRTESDIYFSTPPAPVEWHHQPVLGSLLG